MSEKKTVKKPIKISGYLELGNHFYKVSWLKSVTEKQAIKILCKIGRDINQVKNAHKRANGLSVRNQDK